MRLRCAPRLSRGRCPRGTREPRHRSRFLCRVPGRVRRLANCHSGFFRQPYGVSLTLVSRVASSLPTPFASRLGIRYEPLQLILDLSQSSVGIRSSQAANRRCRETRVVAPPVQANLLRLVDRADDEPDLNGQQLDVREVDFDVTRDHQPLVEYTVEYVD